MSNSAGYDCIVVGAGVAGLAAARGLAEAGRRVLLLEARDRVGGRLLTLHLPGEAAPVELGAEFVHGQPPELLALLDQAGLERYETAGKDMHYGAGELHGAGEDAGAAFSLLEELDADAPDQTFDEFLAARHAPEGDARQAHEADARRARRYVEGFNAADAARIGTVGLARQQAAEKEIEGDRAWRLGAGYSALAEYLRTRVEAAGSTVRLSTPVASVDWQPGSVVVTTAAGKRYPARQVIVTLPLGVLQAGVVRLSPEPAQAMAAARLLAAGAVERVVLRFRSPFWKERAARMRFLFTEDELPPTWWTSAPKESGLLVGWVGGPRALTASGEALVGSGLRSLERIFSLAALSLDRELLSWHMHDWQTDPWTLGAYSYAPRGAAGAAAVLAQPIERTLFFAGEHTDTTGHPGTVHGALRSGLRAASQALAG